MKREQRDSAVAFRVYWKTYALMLLYIVVFAVFEYGLKFHVSAMLHFLATFVVIGRAVQDSQAESNRRFGALLELLEKKKVL